MGARGSHGRARWRSGESRSIAKCLPDADSAFGVRFLTRCCGAPDHGAHEAEPPAMVGGDSEPLDRSAVLGRRLRSEAHRVGKEWASTCKSRWSPHLQNKNF